MLILLMGISVQFVAAQTPQYKYEQGTTANWIPFGAGAGFDGYRMQNLYMPGDFPALISSPPGFITGIYFKASSATSSLVMNDFRVDIGNVAITTLTNSWVTGLTLARPASAYSTPVLASGDWFYIPFPNPVYIDPTQPIVVDVRQTGGSGGISALTGGAHLNTAFNGNVNSIFLANHTGTPSLRTSPYLNHFGFDFFSGYPCDDTPKTSIAGPKKACYNRPFQLKPDSAYSDATYKWEYSNNGFSWANFTGPVGVLGDINDSVTTTKWYRLTVTCINNQSLTWTTPPLRVDIAPFYYCYCINSVKSAEGNDLGNITISGATKLDTVYDKAKLVTGTGLPEYGNNQANRKYTPYHDSLGWPCLYRDSSYVFSASQIHSGNSFQGGFVQAYIDFNRDGLYDPNTEKLSVQSFNGSGSTPNSLRFSFTVPLDTNKSKIGPTGLRVILSESPLSTVPCDTIDGGGEVEDYIVDICERPCTGPVSGGIIVSTDTGMCKDYEYTLTDTTYARDVSAFSRAWQVSGDNISWNNIANSLNKDTLERIFDGQPLFYRLRTICLPTHDTAYSASTKINVKPGYKCYCYSKALGGITYDSSDIGGLSVGPFSKNEGGPHLLNQLAKYPRTDYTDKAPIELYTDSTYSFYVYHTMKVVEHGDAKVTIFMDFNNNHQYDIPEERVYTGFTAIGNHTLVDKVIIPFRAITDLPTGMRVILNNDVGPNVPSDEACGGYTSGETEDFILIFRKKWGVNVLNASNIEAFNVHPNPSSGKFSVQFSTNSSVKEVKVRVTTISGQLVKEQMYSHDGGMFYQPIDITGQAAGVYFVELNADGQKMIEKLIIN